MEDPPSIRIGAIRMACRVLVILVTTAFFVVKFAAVSLLNRLRGKQHPTAGSCLVALLTSLGPTFVKAGQLASMRQDLLPEHVTHSLRRLWTEAASPPGWDVDSVVRGELGARAKMIASIGSEPLGSGCFAVVYPARLHDGRAIAVKLRRPGVDRLVRADLAIGRTGARLLGLLPILTSVPLRTAFERIAAAIERQLDFDEERKAHAAALRNFKSSHAVWIPPLLSELCTPSLLSMERVPRATPILSAELAPAQSVRLAERLVRVLFKMIFEDGLVHVDMHPGNLMVADQHYLVVIDFGCVVWLSRSERDAFSSFFFGVATNDAERCLDVMIRSAESLPSTLDRQALGTDLRVLLQQYYGLTAKEFSVAEFVSALFNLQRAYGIVGTPGFTGAILALFVVEPVIRRLHGTLDFQGIARDVLVRTMFGSPVAV